MRPSPAANDDIRQAHKYRVSLLVCVAICEDLAVNKAMRPNSSANDWKELFDAALEEGDPLLSPQRLQHARDAIVHKIEATFHTASSADRRLLLGALNTISGLCEAGKIPRTQTPQTMSHSA